MSFYNGPGHRYQITNCNRQEEWICGGFYIKSATLKRFFIFHFILPFIICGIIIIHVYYLHYLSSNNSLGYNINNFKILFFPFINYKDIFGLLLNGKATKIQLFIGIFTLSHPDNAFQVNELITPLHIVPEWYFLSYYTMLKAIPNKNAGFIILLTSILILMLFLSLLGSLGDSLGEPVNSGHPSNTKPPKTDMRQLPTSVPQRPPSKPTSMGLGAATSFRWPLGKKRARR